MSEIREKLLECVKRPLNDEQLEAIFSDANTVVSAGAGSGKTTVLSIRFLRLLMERKAHSDEILTLTFTRKAALEMNERIKALASSSPYVDDEDKKRLSSAAISTLDSFVARIVRLDSARYGIARDFTTEEDSESRADRLRRLSQRFFAEGANRECISALAALYRPEDVTTDFFAFIDSNATIVGDYSAEDTTAWLKSYLTPRFEEAKEALQEALWKISGVKNEDNAAAARAQIENIDNGKAINAKAFDKRKLKKDEKPFFDGFEGFAEVYNATLPIVTATGVSPLQLAVERFASLLVEEKRRTAVLTFADVMDLALDILKNNLPLRQHFKEAYKYIMIDEFQDNNSRQRDLLFLLSEKLDVQNPGRVPEAGELEGGKLFFVGDEKQSIYLFRGADVSVFRNLQDEISQHGGRALKLSTNYRSTRQLINHYNSVFAKVFESAARPFDARHEETLVGKDGDVESSITLLCANRADVTGDEARADEVEAAALASLVKKILNGEDCLIDGRAAREDEIAILFAKRSYQVSYEIALKRLGIPYQVGETMSLMQQALAGDFYSFLQALLHSEDGGSYAAVLRSPFARISDAGVITLITGEGELSPSDRERHEAFSAFYEKVRSCLFTSSVAQLVSMLYYEGGYHAYLQSRGDYASYEEHYDYLYAYALSYDKTDHPLTGYLSFLRERLGSRERLDEVAFLHERREGVQIMTVHAAKGLEFPIVILASCAQKNTPEREKYVFLHQNRLIATASGGLAKILKDDAAARAEAEAKRLLYVALTRAERHLVVSGTYKVTKDGIFTKDNGVFFNSYLEALDFDAVSGKAGMEGVRVITIGGDEVEGSTWKSGGDLAQLEALAANYSPKSIVSKPKSAKPSSLEDGTIDDESLPALPADGLYGDRDDASAFGSAVHSYLELTLKGEDTAPVFTDPLFAGSDGRKIAEDLKTMASNFLTSGFYESIRGYGRKCEYRFFSYSGEDDVVYEGVVDLLVDLGDRLLIVDYKSDRTRSREKHKAQILSYIRAMEEIFGKPCLGTLFYLREKENSALWDREGRLVSRDF